VKKLSSPKMGIALEKLNPRAGGSVGLFEAYEIYWLDFKLPEDYKHSCPIFGLRSRAFQDHFNGEVWCAGRRKQPDWIHIGKRLIFTQLCSKLQ